MTDDVPASPLLQWKDYAAASVFEPENMLRETRRQKGLPLIPVPPICVLDPDGDIPRRLAIGPKHFGSIKCERHGRSAAS